MIAFENHIWNDKKGKTWNFNCEMVIYSHSKCITEAERYSAKGFVAKPEKNKGAQKQEIWTECIQELAERPHFDRTTKNVLERIANQSNVPRKKPKFINFLKSSMRYSPTQAEKIWQIIEQGLEEFKKKSAPAAAPAATQPESSTANGDEPSSVNSDAQPDANGNASQNEDNSNGVSNEITLKSVIENAIRQPNLAKSTKKVLKKLQKRADIPLNVKSPKPKKLIKFLKEQFELSAEDGAVISSCLLQSIQTLSTDGIPTECTSKKRKHPSDDSEMDSKRAKTEVIMADSTTDANGESTFDWQKHILRIFNKSNANNQIPLDSLKSKVIKKFLKSVGEDDSKSAQYDKKFKKTLKKIPTLTLSNGVVQLKA